MHTDKWKKPFWNGHTHYNSNYMTFWKKQTIDMVKKKRSIVSENDTGWISEAQGILYGSETILYDAIIVDKWHCIFQNTSDFSAQRVNFNDTYS